MDSRKPISRRSFIKAAALGAASTALLAACGSTTGGSKASGKLEIFSWWTSGGEVEALNGLYNVFKSKYPNIEIVNSAIAGGTSSGGDMKAVLQTRMMGGDPPESFQVHLGGELIDPYLVNNLMEPVDFIYDSEGFRKVFPKGVIDVATYKGHLYAVPVNIHRANVLWYNTKMLADIGVQPPATWEDFITVAEKFKAKGLPALAVAENAPGFYGQVTETMIIQYLGADKFMNLFNGGTSWSEPAIKQGLTMALKVLDYANKDYLSTAWGDVNDLMIGQKVAMMVQGDWTPGVFWSKGFKDFGWADAPGCKDIYQALSDSFGLPKKVKNRDAAIAWLKVCGSKEGQDAFNPAKGSIPARTDADVSKYSDYQKWAMKQWTTNKIIPSIVHGSAAKLSFMTDYMNIINQLAAKKTDVDTTFANLQKAAANANFGK